jgi:hypothetical protein
MFKEGRKQIPLLSTAYITITRCGKERKRRRRARERKHIATSTTAASFSGVDTPFKINVVIIGIELPAIAPRRLALMGENLNRR